LPGWLSLVRPRKGNHSAGLITPSVRDPEVAGSKTPVSETPAPGTPGCSCGGNQRNIIAFHKTPSDLSLSFVPCTK
jgi:hypothetical protein